MLHVETKQMTGRLDRAMTHKLSLMLDKVCKTVDGHSVYEGDWDDQRVADSLGIARHHVKYTRSKVFGPSAKPIGGSSVHKNLTDRVEHLERRVHRLEQLLLQRSV